MADDKCRACRARRDAERDTGHICDQAFKRVRKPKCRCGGVSSSARMPSTAGCPAHEPGADDA